MLHSVRLDQPVDGHESVGALRVPDGRPPLSGPPVPSDGLVSPQNIAPTSLGAEVDDRLATTGGCATVKGCGSSV